MAHPAANQAQSAVNPHLNQPVIEWGRPVADAHAAVIAVHGRERDPQDILLVCARLDRPDLSYLVPTAANGSWYPLSFMVEVAQNEPWLSYTLERVETLVQSLVRRGIDPARIVLLGFSQGACTVIEAALRFPRRYGAVLAFTGGAFGPASSTWNHSGDLAGTPVLISGSVEDGWVPVSRMRETAALLQARNAGVIEYYYKGREHIVNDEEIRAARRILESV